MADKDLTLAMKNSLCASSSDAHPTNHALSSGLNDQHHLSMSTEEGHSMMRNLEL
jgi:hypothetical protein